jgi:dipeptidyl-peptidase-4
VIGADSAITVEDIARFPLPGMVFPTDVAFSPDDQSITFLWSPDASLTRQLYAFDLETGQQAPIVEPTPGLASERSISREEALRRERQRQVTLGVTRYSWAATAEQMVIPMSGAICIQDGIRGRLRTLVERGGPAAIDPRLSPDGRWVAFARGGEVWVISVDRGESRQLTWGAAERGVTRGTAEYIAQEEMGRNHGLWWSPDGERVAFTEVDESDIPLFRIAHLGKDSVGEDAVEAHHYPFAGAANARVRLGVVAVAGGEPLWLDLGADQDIYLARVDWFPDGRLTAQIENREQTRLELVAFEISTGAQTTLLVETSDTWINLHSMLQPLQSTNGRREDGGFVWASERDGFQHLYLYDRSGRLIRQLTSGEWMVDGVSGIDEKRNLVYFTATKESPIECHLYAVPLEGGEVRRITTEPGTHAIVLDRGRNNFIDVHQSLDRPPSLSLRSLDDGELIRIIFDQVDPRIGALELSAPEVVNITSRDGATLYGAVYRPPARFGSGPFPTVVSVYGGPHAQMVTNSWRPTASLRAQHLRGLGYLVFSLDNRGSARRGVRFEGALNRRMGRVEVDDQVDGVRWLVERGLTDPKRVGIYGWSYGGYLAAMCLARSPDTFRVAVAGAPVTHWDGYDTHYTERYMGTPSTNPDGYRLSSVIANVSGIVGRLLLVHGLIDENVHFRHTARLINALTRERKPYELLLFPDERHLPRKVEDRVFMEERVRDFLVRNL